MSNLSRDPDFLDLLAAWHENKVTSPERRKELLVRLQGDPLLRQALADEIEMVGLTQSAQNGEPRWLELEEILQCTKDKNHSFESSLMNLVEKSKIRRAKSSKLVSVVWRSFAIAAVFALAFFNLYVLIKEDNSVAKIIRLEENGKITKAGQSLEAGESLHIENGLIEMVFKETGVHLVGTGPLEVNLTSNDTIFLKRGDVKLVVPPQGVGFVVNTLERKFTDLGTSFVVNASEKGSKVLVLDGEIAVKDKEGNPDQLMTEGSSATFDRNGTFSLRAVKDSGVHELKFSSNIPSDNSLSGKIFGIPQISSYQNNINKTYKFSRVDQKMLPLVRSQFTDLSSIKDMIQGSPLRFEGIAGTYNNFPINNQLAPYSLKQGWLAWYSGKVKPPQKGRYRFWGYADNHLLVAINGKPVFEGSRSDSSFRHSINIKRNNHPSFPCLNAVAGFASGVWFAVGNKPVKIDLLFGESRMQATSGILLIEYQGQSYPTTYWGQPMWDLFLTEFPSKYRIKEFEKLRLQMEEKIMGSFSLNKKSVWKVISNSSY